MQGNLSNLGGGAKESPDSQTVSGTPDGKPHLRPRSFLERDICHDAGVRDVGTLPIRLPSRTCLLMGIPPKTNLLGLSHATLGRWLDEKGIGRSRLKLLYGTLHRSFDLPLRRLPGINAAFLDEIGHHAFVADLQREESIRSEEIPPTTKVVARTADGERVECVLLPRRDGRFTACISTQIGCRQACAFCRTGQAGFRRDLDGAEILSQYRMLRDEVGPDKQVSHVVFMGMGEALDNYGSSMDAYRVLVDSRAYGLAQDHVTLSTAGHVDGIERLGREGFRVSLAVSLNATTDALRDRLMPINRRWPLDRLIGSLRRFPLRPGRTIVIEYVLIDGLNDSDADVDRLKKLLDGLPVKINLIRYNEIEGLPWKRPRESRVEAFADALEGYSRGVLLRSSMGGPVLAACGQLAFGPASPKGEACS